MRNKYIYGKTHHIKFQYKKRIHEVCTKYLDKARQLSSDYRINNLIVDLRNDMCCILDEIYQQLSIELKHNMIIKPEKRKTYSILNNAKLQKCIICSEHRIVDRCHIIPRMHSGSNAEDNMIYLCPNHHFLFDQGKLTKEEFEKITILDKAKDAIEFFNKVHRMHHQKYWEQFKKG